MGRLGRATCTPHLISAPDQSGWKQMYILIEKLRVYCLNINTYCHACLTSIHFIAVCTPQFYRIVCTYLVQQGEIHILLFLTKKKRMKVFLKCKTKTTTSIRLLLQIYNMRNTPRDANVVHFVVLQTKKRFLFDVHLWLSAVSQKNKVYF